MQGTGLRVIPEAEQGRGRLLIKYSVIIPVYNAEKTLGRCVDSILEQNCSDAEVILVNDGSRDDSGAICEKYAAEYQNVRYIPQANGGVSAARNTGLDAAQGEYILFVDSDDYVSPTFFSLVREALDAHPADLLHFSHASFQGEKVTEHRLTSREYTGAEMERALQQAICDKTLNAPWAKVYRRDLIAENHIRFPLGISIAEDRLFNMEYALQIQSYSTRHEIGYYLSVENEHSLSRRKNDMETQDRLYGKAFEEMITRSSGSAERKDLVRRAYSFGVCRSVYARAKNMHREQMRLPDRVRGIRALCKQFNGQRMKMPNTRYSRMVSLPIRWNLALLIDAMAAVLVRR